MSFPETRSNYSHYSSSTKRNKVMYANLFMAVHLYFKYVLAKVNVFEVGEGYVTASPQ